MSNSQISALVLSGATTAEQVVAASLRAVEDLDDELNAFTAVLSEQALSDARRIDQNIADGGNPGPLAGVPFAVKNLFDVAGVPTLAGSKIRAHGPAPSKDAAAVANLRRAGAILVGCTNMDEFAHGFTTENTHYGTTRNPHDLTRIAGGSSGGSAAAVAAGIVPLALGSDTNGSIRVPASLCGVLGLKPTFGRISRAGTVLFVTSLDHVGPLARDTSELAAAYDVLQGYDSHDPVSVDAPVHACAPVLDRGIDGVRFAVASAHFARVADEDATAAVAVVAQALGIDREVAVEQTSRACAAASLITSAEGGQRHASALRMQAADYDPHVRPGLLSGLLIPASVYLASQRFRSWYREEVRRAFANVDVLVMAATPCTAPAIGQRTMLVDGEELLVGMSLGLLAQPWAFVGCPALTVPLPSRTGLPVGVQLVAAPFNEAALFRTAAFLEAAGLLVQQPEGLTL
ncbi:AtzE family amidohydrolase [soil metagenome]